MEAAKLDRAPTLVASRAALHRRADQDEEDVCATAAAIMLVLLGATERGLASYWRTAAFSAPRAAGEAVSVPRTASACSACSTSGRRAGSRPRASADPVETLRGIPSVAGRSGIDPGDAG